MELCGLKKGFPYEKTKKTLKKDTFV